MKDFTFDIVAKFLSIPYRYEGSSFDGADCYGLICLWYKYMLNIDLFDYKRPGKSVHDVSGGYMRSFSMNQFEEVSYPEDHCVCLMLDEEGLERHVGVYIKSNIVHARFNGVEITPYSEIKNKITSMYKYRREK